MAKVNEIVIEETPRTYKVFFPYKHDIGWRGFKQVGMRFKEPQNIGGSPEGVYWMIPKDKLKEALDVIQYWYTERPLVGMPEYGVRVVKADEDAFVGAARVNVPTTEWQVAA